MNTWLRPRFPTEGSQKLERENQVFKETNGFWKALSRNSLRVLTLAAKDLGRSVSVFLQILACCYPVSRTIHKNKRKTFNFWAALGVTLKKT